MVCLVLASVNDVVQNQDMIRRFLLLLCALATASCNVDAVLEEEVPPEIHLAIAVTGTHLALAPGVTATIDASIPRLGEYAGEVNFSLANVPDGVSATIGALTTAGKVSSATITFTAGATLAAGSYLITLKANVGSATKTAA